MSSFSLFSALLLAAATPPSAQDTKSDPEQPCLEAQKAADNPDVGCPELRRCQESLESESIPDSVLCLGVRTRLRDRMPIVCEDESAPSPPVISSPHKQAGGAESDSKAEDPCSPDRVKVLKRLIDSGAKRTSDAGARRTRARALHVLLECEVNRCHSPPANCRNLDALRMELARATVARLRLFHEYSPSAVKLEKDLVAIGSTEQLIAVLRRRGLDEKQARNLVQIALAHPDHHAVLDEITARLSVLEGKLATAELVAVIDKVFQLYGRTNGDLSELERRLEIAESLSNADTRQEMKRIVERLEKDPLLRTEARAVGSEMNKGEKADLNIVAPFFEYVYALGLAHFGNAATQSHFYLVMEWASAYGRSPVFVVHSSVAKPGCSGEDEYLRRFMKRVSFNFGPKSGLRPPLDATQVNNGGIDLKATIAAFLKAPSRGSPLCNANESFHAALCDPLMPMAGAYLVRFDRDTDGSLKAAVHWWATTDEPGRVDDGELPSDPALHFRDCDTEGAHGAALKTAELAVDNVSTLKNPPPLIPSRPTSRGSSLSALAFAGAPYLADDRASTGTRIVFSAGDIALLAGTVVTAALSVEYRNDFATGREPSLGRANDFGKAAIVLGASLLALRVASGLIHGYGSDLWANKEPAGGTK